ncbi:MAG: hypothetical protein CV089_16335 [Nitrospira sp. WS110]|nr:hypothetical protein [Nitrospira sp. WS110]
MAQKLYDWLDARLKLQPLGHTLLDERIPGGASWIYVFGSATLFLFCLQATTDMFLALHTLFLPALIVGGIGLHLFILRRVGPAGPWNMAKAQQRSETFYPRQVYMDAVVMLGLFLSHLHAGYGVVLSALLSISELHVRTVGAGGDVGPPDHGHTRTVAAAVLGSEPGPAATLAPGGNADRSLLPGDRVHVAGDLDSGFPGDIETRSVCGTGEVGFHSEPLHGLS